MNKDSESSSDHSDRGGDVCTSVKCQKKCCLDCDIEERECLRPEVLLCQNRDAVVEIHSEFILLGPEVEEANGNTPLEAGKRADVILEGNGFFIKGHYIVAPAHLVLLPPSLTSVANRYPFFDPKDLELGKIKNQMIRASRILVSVFNVNGYGEGFVYEADLVGVDGAGDIAVLRINYEKQWNCPNPCVKQCHPYLDYGESRAIADGEKAYVIGDYIADNRTRAAFNGVGLISEGLVSDHRHTDYSGWLLAESIIVSTNVYSFSAGLPILDCQGRLIGMQTTDIFGDGYVGGPSIFFMKRIIKTLIKGDCDKKASCHLEVICDPLGAYYRYRKAYLGLAYDVFTGVDYDTTVDYTSGPSPLGRPRVRLDSEGKFLNSPSCKHLIGLRVLGLAGLNPDDQPGVPNGRYFVPSAGGNEFLALLELPNSPLKDKLNPGDVITHIDGVAVGDLLKQISPSLITWRQCKGDCLKIRYRQGGNQLNESNNGATSNYDTLDDLSVRLKDYPLALDYPWYAVEQFPLLLAAPYPKFTFPPGQLQNRQVIQRDTPNDPAPFHPAI